MAPTLIVTAALLGAAAGLLLPRPAHRLAVDPGDPWRATAPDGTPIPGWIGPARTTHSGWYGPNTPATATATALLCAALATAAGPVPELCVWLLMAPVLVLLALVDGAVQRLPDVLTLPLAAATAALLGLAALVPGAKGSWTHALLGACALGGGYFVLFLVNPRGMGFGDVKLATSLGLALGWYGWGVLMLGALAGFVYGSLYGLSLVLRGRATRKTALPFGPFMVAGAFTGLLLGGFGA
ncbi:prepilin peptidase [Streptomyces beijiangensis]|uniref:Prepilin peptidase n=1 Tax=Streptomyces beijiangensis TaxID=163361 RepID=A0A939F3Y0_9ACTN|nr:prepilin peptidase [Streptomyces beijiangensis]MBO0512106.1 prepilin peptidase [Streptomyces beijiangensis]